MREIEYNTERFVVGQIVVDDYGVICEVIKKEYNSNYGVCYKIKNERGDTRYLHHSELQLFDHQNTTHMRYL